MPSAQTVKEEFEERICEILEAHGVNIKQVLPESVRIEIGEFGPVLRAEVFIGITLTELKGDA